MQKIRQAMRNLALDQRVMRIGNFALACTLLCLASGGCSFGRNDGIGANDFLPTAHSDAIPVTGRVGNSQSDIVANNTSVEILHEPRLIERAPALQRAGSVAPEQQQLQQQFSQQQQQQNVQQQPHNNYPPVTANQNQYNRNDQTPSSTHLSNAAQSEYLEALTNAGVSDPVERAEILESLAGMTSEGRKTFFKMFNMTRKGQSDQDMTRQVTQSTNGENQGNSKVGNRVAKNQNSTNRQQSIATGYEQTASGPKPRLELGKHYEGDNDAEQKELFDNPLRNYSSRNFRGNSLRSTSEQDHAADLLRAANQQAVIQASFNDDAAGYDWDQKGKSITSTQRDQIGQDFVSKPTNDQQLNNIISQAEDDLKSNPPSSNAMAQQIRLRLLYAVSGKRDQALDPIPGMSRAQQEFLNQQVFGLAAMMPNDKSLSFARQCSIAAEHFKLAAEQLGQSAGLQIKNPTLCTEIKGFGDYKKFETESFRASQEVLLYAELENFRTESTADGFRTHFNARYQILDARGQKIEEHDLTQVSENARNRRRDYFVSYHLNLPATLMSGEYTLKLIVEDLNSGLFGENSLKFQVGQTPLPLPTVQR